MSVVMSGYAISYDEGSFVCINDVSIGHESYKLLGHKVYKASLQALGATSLFGAFSNLIQSIGKLLGIVSKGPVVAKDKKFTASVVGDAIKSSISEESSNPVEAARTSIESLSLAFNIKSVAKTSSAANLLMGLDLAVDQDLSAYSEAESSVIPPRTEQQELFFQGLYAEDPDDYKDYGYQEEGLPLVGENFGLAGLERPNAGLKEGSELSHSDYGTGSLASSAYGIDPFAYEGDYDIYNM